MDFNYVVQRQEKTKVCFGSGLERKFLDFDKNGLVSKHARSNIRELYDVGPGSYDISEQTSALSGTLRKPTSKLGTVLGGRKAERKEAFFSNMVTPGPEYNIPSLFSSEFKQSCAPFNTWAKRMNIKSPDNPGVGVYNVTSYKRRRATFGHSFGGTTCLIPAVKMKCGPFNFDKCERCTKFPEGDYWFVDTTEMTTKPGKKKSKGASQCLFLCRPCYELEKRENKLFSVMQMRKFRKLRDCSKVHFHDGCQAKLFLVSPQEIAKMKEREAYLSLYFS